MVARSRLIAVVLLFAVFGGCRKTVKPCAPSLPATLEIRGATGELELAVKQSPNAVALDLCDGAAERVGGVVRDEGVLTLLDAQGGLGLRLSRDSEKEERGSGKAGARLRVYRDGVSIRVLQPDGIPFGELTQTENGGQAFDRASLPIVKSEARGSDQVLRSPDGAVRFYVVPSAAPREAGIFALDGLTRPEQVALYLFWKGAP